MDPSAFHRRLAVTGLVGSALLLSASVVVQPDLNGAGAAVLARIDAQGATAAFSAAGFALAQLPYIAAVLGIAHLLRARAAALGGWGAVVSVVGASGHAVSGGTSLVFVVMAHDVAHRAVYGGLVEELQTSPVMIFSLLGLAGFAIGLVLLSIGLFRGRVGPRWAGPAIWVFLLLEIVGTGLSHDASYLSTTVLLVTFLALAREAHRGWDRAPVPEQEVATVAS